MKKAVKVLGATIVTLSICAAMSISAIYANPMKKQEDSIPQVTQTNKEIKEVKVIKETKEIKDIKQNIGDNMKKNSDIEKTKNSDSEKKHGKKLTEAQKLQKNLQISDDFKTTLDYFVSKGKITQAEADAAYKLFSENTGKINFSDFSKSVREAFKDLKATYTTLTGEQKNAIKQAIAVKIQAAIDGLVAGKIITEEQGKDLVSNYGKRNINFTEQQKTIIFDMASVAKAAALDELKETRVITPDQADGLKLFTIKLNEVKEHGKF